MISAAFKIEYLSVFHFVLPDGLPFCRNSLIFFVRYRTRETPIISVQTAMNAVETTGGIEPQNTWSTIVPYSKAVAIFPCQTAWGTMPVFRISAMQSTAIQISLMISKASGNAIRRKRTSRQISITACVNLSATGSSILPRSLIIEKRLAMKPSKQSVAPERSRKHPVAKLFCITI